MKSAAKIISCLVFLFPLIGAAQDAQSPRVEHIMPKISLLSPALGCEFGLTQKATVFVQAGIDFNFTANASTNNGSGSYSVVFPIVQAEIRNYYSMQARQNKGKNWRGNTGGFFGGDLAYRFEAISEHAEGNIYIIEPYEPSFSLGAVWGFQYTAVKNSNFNFSISIGPGLVFAKDRPVDFNFIGHLNLGFVLGNYKEGR